jgi:hypothetical protein
MIWVSVLSVENTQYLKVKKKMKVRKKNIKTGYWVCLDGKPWFPDAYTRGDDRRSIADMREENPKGYKRLYYYKVVKMSPLTYEHKLSGYTARDTFYLRWVTDVQSSYQNVIKAREGK